MYIIIYYYIIYSLIKKINYTLKYFGKSFGKIIKKNSPYVHIILCVLYPSIGATSVRVCVRFAITWSKACLCGVKAAVTEDTWNMWWSGWNSRNTVQPAVDTCVNTPDTWSNSGRSLSRGPIRLLLITITNDLMIIKLIEGNLYTWMCAKTISKLFLVFSFLFYKYNLMYVIELHSRCPWLWEYDSFTLKLLWKMM